MSSTATTQRIIVGVDGSAASDAALRWAHEEAKLRGATLVAVHAWSYPYTAGAAGAGAYVLPWDDLELVAKKTMTEALGRAAGDDHSVKVEEVVHYGSAASLLCELAEDAALLVVGSRGHGGFSGLLLGSVSSHCAHHAGCPVVIVRAAS